MNHRFRSLLVGLPILLAVGCSSNLKFDETPITSNDPAGTGKPASANQAEFDPANSKIPLPNLLLTGAAGPVTPQAGVPLTPDKALAYINQREVGGTNAVTGITAPIYMRFAAPVDKASVLAGGVRIFQVLPDANGLTENGTLGFLDITGLFDLDKDAQGNPTLLENGTAVLLFPKVSLTPGSRYAYVVTDKLKDATTTLPLSNNLALGFASQSTPLVDFNQAGSLPGTYKSLTVLTDDQATGLEKIRGNVTSSGAILISGYGKLVDDLIANGAADASGKAASGAGATGIKARGEIKLLGRFITTAAGAIVPDPSTPNGRAPVETALWVWANNVNVAPLGLNFSTAESRAWSNSAAFTTVLPGTPGVEGYLAALGLDPSKVPHGALGGVILGNFQSGDLNMDPAVVAATSGKPTTGDLTGTANVYNPGSGAGAVPGTGVLQASRNSSGLLRGFYHTTRTVPFVFIAPGGTAPAGGWPILIFQHGLGGRKENVVAMANAACAAGYAVIAIDISLHGELGNGRPAAEWTPNFISLPSALNTRTNLQNAAFNLWRLERVLKQPAIDPTGFQARAAAAGFPTSPAGATRYVGISLGSIVGTHFLAGNSAQTGGSNIKALLSVPGERLTYILRDSPTFSPTINAGLQAAGIATGSATYNQFMVLTQSVVDPADPGYLTFPISASAPSRLSGRVVMQEAIGDVVIPNIHTRALANSLGGRGVLGSPALDTAPNFKQITLATASAPTVPFLLATGALKAFAAPATDPGTGPAEGYYQFGTPTSPANHGMLLDGSANTPLVQKQMVIWLLTGRVADPTDTSHWPLAAPLGDEGQTLRVIPMINGPE